MILIFLYLKSDFEESQNLNEVFTKLHRFSEYSQGSMPPNSRNTRAAIISLFLYENNHFCYSVFYQNIQQKRIFCNMFSIYFQGYKDSQQA